MYHMFSSLEHMEAVGRPVAGINRIVGVGDNPRGGIADIPVMNIRTSLHLYGSCTILTNLQPCAEIVHEGVLHGALVGSFFRTPWHKQFKELVH